MSEDFRRRFNVFLEIIQCLMRLVTESPDLPLMHFSLHGVYFVAPYVYFWIYPDHQNNQMSRSLLFLSPMHFSLYYVHISRSRDVRLNVVAFCWCLLPQFTNPGDDGDAWKKKRPTQNLKDWSYLRRRQLWHSRIFFKLCSSPSSLLYGVSN